MKASVNFMKICCIISILCKFLSLPQISDYHHLNPFNRYVLCSYNFGSLMATTFCTLTEIIVITLISVVFHQRGFFFIISVF